MVSGPIGITFSPTTDQAAMAKKNWSTQGGSPEAIQILSLHVPKVAGPRALAPDQLLQQQPGQNPVQSVVNSILQGLGRLPAPTQGAAAGAPGAVPGATPTGANEPQDLAAMLRQVLGNSGTQRFEPTPSVTPGILPGDRMPTDMPPVQREWQAPAAPSAPPADVPGTFKDGSVFRTNGGFQTGMQF